MEGHRRFVLDRFEGEFAVLEGVGSVPRAALPSDAREGDVVVLLESAEGVTYGVDSDATSLRRAQAEALRSSLLTLQADNDEVIEL